MSAYPECARWHSGIPAFTEKELCASQETKCPVCATTDGEFVAQEWIKVGTARKSQTPLKHLNPPIRRPGAAALAGVSPTLKIHQHAAWQARR